MSKPLEALNRNISASNPIRMPYGAALIAGTSRVAGWSGNVATMNRLSDNNQVGIGIGKGYLINEASIITHQGVSSDSFKNFLDQSGNGLNPEQTTVADMPYYAADRKRRGLVGASMLEGRKFTLPNGLSVNRQSLTVICVHAPQYNGEAVWQLGTGTTDRLALYNGPDLSAGLRDTVTTPSYLYHPSQLCVDVVTSSAAGKRLRINQRDSGLLAASTSTTMTGGMLGGADSLNYYGNIYFFAVYLRVLSDAEIVWAERQLIAKYKIVTKPQINIIAPGDSIRAGYKAGGLPGTEFMEENYLSRKPIEIRNTGIVGRKLQEIMDGFGNTVLAQYRRDVPLNGLLSRGGNNDATDGADMAALYSDYILFRQKAYEVGFDFTIDEDSQARAGDATFQGKRTAFNNSRATNTANFSYLVKYSLSFTDYTDTSLYFSDQVHLLAPGQKIAGDIMFTQGVQYGMVLTPTPKPPITYDPTLGATVTPDLWLNPNNNTLANIIAPANRISQFNDSGSGGFNATQGTHDLRPALYQRKLNGQPAMVYSTGNGLALPAGFLSAGGGANTLVIVFRADLTGDATRYLLAGLTSGSGWRYGINYTSSQINFLNRSSNAPASMAWTLDTNTHIVGFVRNGSTITPFLDGVAGTPATADNVTTVTQMTLGAATVAAVSSRHAGAMGPVLHYNAAFSNAQLNALCSPMATNYGATWTGL